MTPNPLFSELLKKYRTLANLSQSELAELSKIPLQTLQAYEAGRREPGWSRVCALAKALKVKLTAFEVKSA